jgi:hypothetical protein
MMIHSAHHWCLAQSSYSADKERRWECVASTEEEAHLPLAPTAAASGLKEPAHATVIKTIGNMTHAKSP